MTTKATTCSACGGSGEIPTGETLRERRVDAGWSLGGLAEEWGVSGTYLSDIERGKRPLSPRMRERYEKLVELS